MRVAPTQGSIAHSSHRWGSGTSMHGCCVRRRLSCEFDADQGSSGTWVVLLLSQRLDTKKRDISVVAGAPLLCVGG